MNAGTGSRSSAAPGKKPRIALFIATAVGLGYIPFGPGTFGSLAGLLLAMAPWWLIVVAARMSGGVGFWGFDFLLYAQCILTAVAAALGVWAASRAAVFFREKDPQRVVIDEVSGQHLTLLLGLALPIWWRPSPEAWKDFPLGVIASDSVLSWKYLLLGLILFRVFDIWKPYPVRQAERLPGGWGIMADDWVAAIYAALGLWIARAAGL